MSAFARQTFSAGSYAAFRPSYPKSLFSNLLKHHKQTQPPSGTLVDLGCGHGLISRELAPAFAKVFALDPSAGMVKQAKSQTPQQNVEIRQGSAEDLSFLPDASVDMVVAGQAAHWFDYGKTWPELARVVKKGGTLAFWGYKDHVIVGQPATTAVFERFTYGPSPIPGPGKMESLQRFWEMPGRAILRDSYRAIVPPEEDWTDVTRVEWEPDRETAEVGEVPQDALWMEKRLKLGELEGYVRTYSSYRSWRDEHGDIKSRAEGGEGDVVDRMFDEVVAVVPEWKGRDDWREIEVDAVWGTVVLLAKRR